MNEKLNPLYDEPNCDYSLVIVRPVIDWFPYATAVYRENRPLVIVHPVERLFTEEQLTEAK